jgi:glycosyltransferase involved in cell wall biosynthesis
MRVSIITAVYNGGPSIAATLRSVASQDYDSIEHIVIDGASTDNTLEVVRSNNERIAMVVSEPDAGVYDAFNKGLSHATGDVVAFLNAGDSYVSPYVVSSAIGELSRPGIDAVFGDVLIVDVHDESRTVRRYSSKRFSRSALAYGFMPAHPTLFLRREVYAMVGEYDTSYRIAGDFELCLRVFSTRSTRYKYIPEALVKMPMGGLSNRGWRSTWAITREMRSACGQNGVQTNWIKLCMRLPLKMLEMI